MDTRTGEICLPKTFEQMKKEMSKNELKHFKPMKIMPTQSQLNKKPPQVGRNDTCPCNSGKKFKHCCLEK